MKVSYLVNQFKYQTEAGHDPAIFCKNKIDSHFYLFPEGNKTRYQGWYIKNTAWESGSAWGGDTSNPFIKIIDQFIFYDESGNPLFVKEITQSENNYFWQFNNGDWVGFYLNEYSNNLSIYSENVLRFDLCIDVRGIYQNPDLGRNYTVVNQGETTPTNRANTTITYEDGLLGHVVNIGLYTDYQTKTTIKDIHRRSQYEENEITNIDVYSPLIWDEAYYPRDDKRHSYPINMYTTKVARIKGKKLNISVALGKIEKNPIFKDQQPSLPEIQTAINSSTKNRLEVARYFVAKGLDWLETSKGYYAGLPWFHQIWSRDELITALGLPKKKQLEVIERYLNYPTENGELPTFINSGTTCADGLGWLCLLIKEYGIENLSENTKKHLISNLKTAYTGLVENRRGTNGLIHSGHNNTWMDTIGRAGYILEIQGMYALMLQLLYELTQDETYSREKTSAVGLIKSNYYLNGVLKDKTDDDSIRPNIFITYLLCPDILSQERWEECFEKTFNILYCPWSNKDGGLASLDPTHPDFQPYSTGQDNVSYHQGDSWFFVNNLSILAMHRLNNNKFRPQIDLVLNGSYQEVLSVHMLGMPGEISSAEALYSWGCGLQGFSGGAFLKAIESI